MITELPDALDHFDDVWRDLGCTLPVLFLDYDGTLTPIVDRPEDAVLDSRMRAILQRLAAAMPVLIVSGRDRDDVMDLVSVRGVWYAGSHGFDIAGPDGFEFRHPGGAATLAALASSADRLEEALAGLEGVTVERKRFAVAVHRRRARRDDAARALAIFDGIADSSPGLRRSAGKEVTELRPDVDWHKGSALRWLLDEVVPKPHGAPLYVGDDLTDEDAFAEIRDDGVGIVVHGGDHRSAARYSLRAPEAVRSFLERLL